jgi:putative transposase
MNSRRSRYAIWFYDDKPGGICFLKESAVDVPVQLEWRRRSPGKVMERTHEEATEALHAGRESRHPEAAFVGQGAHSKLCDELGLQPTVFYRWQKEFFENGAAAFEQRRPANRAAEQERIAYLEKKIQTKDEVLAELMSEHVALKKRWGNSDRWSGFRTIRGIRSWISSGAGRRRPRSAPGGSSHVSIFLDISTSKFHDWRECYGKVNEHNGWVPRDFWLEDWEKQAIIGFHLKNPLEGCRRLTFMMLDAGIVAVSPTSVWSVLGQA